MCLEICVYLLTVKSVSVLRDGSVLSADICVRASIGAMKSV